MVYRAIMISRPPHSTAAEYGPYHHHPTITGTLGAVALLVGLLFALSYPVVTVAVVAGAIAGVKFAQLGLSLFVARLHGRVRELTVPGVGTVEFRISPK